MSGIQHPRVPPLAPLQWGHSIKWLTQYTQHLGSCNTYAFPYLYATARLETLFRSMVLWRKAHAKVCRNLNQSLYSHSTEASLWGLCKVNSISMQLLKEVQEKTKQNKTMYLQSSCFICLKGFLGKVVLTGFLIEVWIRVNFDTGLLPVL